MCRLFGLLANDGSSAEPWLVTSERSLLRQSNVPGRAAQRDGWGIAWYAEGPEPRAQVEKGIGGAFADGERPRFVRAAERARAPLVIGHLRHASNPMHLPRARLIALENSQPFQDGMVLFAHNGSIPFPRETRPRLGDFESRIQGVNDSEVLFWLLQRHLADGREPVDAYARTVHDLVGVWRKTGSSSTAPYEALNLLFARGPEELWAFCLSHGRVGSSFFDRHRPFYEMTYLAEPDRVVVGSEPFDRRPGVWRSIPNGTYLAARRETGRVRVDTGPIPLASALAPSLSAA